jgi:hypothetical protein
VLGGFPDKVLDDAKFSFLEDFYSDSHKELQTLEVVFLNAI